jgi:hypothetical protein
MGPPQKIARIETPTAVKNGDGLAPVDDKPEGDSISTPSANDTSKKPSWAQVFATLQQTGLAERALEFASRLRALRTTIQELFDQYKAALTSEEELLYFAYREALAEYQRQQGVQPGQGMEQALSGINTQGMDAAYGEAMRLQLQAQQEVQAHAQDLQRTVSGAHQRANRALAEKKGDGIPHPRRPGMAACEFFVKTGECRYGMGCKWDHPTEIPETLNSQGLPLRPGSAPMGGPAGRFARSQPY